MNQRPLSPHLGVYKLTHTMLLSGLHRVTGMAATLGFFVFIWWLMRLAKGVDAYGVAMQALASPPGRLVLAGFVFSLVYHTCNGIRHLVWDTGRGLERAQARRSGVVVVIAALLLTGLLLWAGCAALAAPPGSGSP